MSKYLFENKYLSIASIDMNGLKHINDNYGHAEGDEALCRLGGVLEGLINNEEVCARTGGDEFLVVLYSDSRERDAKFIKEFMLAMQEEEKKKKRELRREIKDLKHYKEKLEENPDDSVYKTLAEASERKIKKLQDEGVTI